MHPEKIYSLFLEKLEDQIKNQILTTLKVSNFSEKREKFRIIISFENISDRERFVSKHKNLEIIIKFDLIPTINLLLTFEQIQDLKSDGLVKRIEEDQQLYLSMHDVNEILGVSDYRKKQIVFTGNGVIVGIIDEGINRNFDSISNLVVNQYTITKESEKKKVESEKNIVTHGTLMASIIGNQYVDINNDRIGIAPNVKIIDLDISNSDNTYYFSNVLEVFDLIIAKNIKMDVLLIALTTIHPSDGKDILSMACNRLVDNGYIITCPAGNFGPESRTIGSPSAAEKVITIGSLTKKGTIAYYSGRGPTLDNRIKPDFCLPGSGVEIPLSRDILINFSGTSVAASIGTAIIALIKEFHPNCSFNEILDIFEKARFDLDYVKTSQGFGTTSIVNIFKTLDLCHERTLSYNHIVKKSFVFSLVFIVIFLILFYLPFIFNFLRSYIGV